MISDQARAEIEPEFADLNRARLVASLAAVRSLDVRKASLRELWRLWLRASRRRSRRLEGAWAEWFDVGGEG